MSEQKVVISLTGADIQAVEQAVLDRDREAALAFLTRVVKARIDAELRKGRCKPVFEMTKGTDLNVTGPPRPPGDQKQRGRVEWTRYAPCSGEFGEPV